MLRSQFRRHRAGRRGPDALTRVRKRPGPPLDRSHPMARSSRTSNLNDQPAEPVHLARSRGCPRHRRTCSMNRNWPPGRSGGQAQAAANPSDPRTPVELDLTSGEITTLLWATGFRPDYSWLDIPGHDRAGQFRHDGGVVTSAPGLYLLGLPVLRTRASTYIHPSPARSCRAARSLARRPLVWRNARGVATRGRGPGTGTGSPQGPRSTPGQR